MSDDQPTDSPLLNMLISKGKELEERGICGVCGGVQALFDGVREASQLEDTCTCPVEPPELTEMKREQAHMAAALKKDHMKNDQIVCRSCSNKGRNLLGLPCVCGSPFDPPYTAEEIKDLVAIARREGLKAAVTLLREKAVEAFELSNDPLANAFRTVAAEVEELASPKKKQIDY